MFKTKKEARAYHAKWRENNPEKVKASQKKYYDLNKENRIANVRRWEVANPEKVLAKRRKRQPKIKQWKKDNPDKIRAGYRRQRYGITPEQYDRMVLEQSNKCAICQKPESIIDYRTGELRSLAVDHDHEIDKPRALLCRRCNAGMGMFEDNIELLQVAVNYLKKFQYLKDSLCLK